MPIFVTIGQCEQKNNLLRLAGGGKEKEPPIPLEELRVTCDTTHMAM